MTAKYDSYRVWCVLLFALATTSAGAQHAGDSVHAAAGAARAMSGGDRSAAHAKHLAWTPVRALTRRDSVRAMAIADTLRRAIARYTDTAEAMRAGYKLFAPQVKEQAVYHFTNNAAGLLAAFRFDPSRPTSLLYRKDTTGALRLTGAMYTAPARYTATQLNARVPLAAAQWHQHVNLCVPLDDVELDKLRRGESSSRFGLTGDIADRAACEKAGGRFLPRIYGWMVHANVFDGSGVRDVWETATSHDNSRAAHKH